MILAFKDERKNTGAHDWNRTNDLLLTKEVLYRLSYVSGGAGDGNRTRTSSLEGYSSTIELLPPGGTSHLSL